MPRAIFYKKQTKMNPSADGSVSTPSLRSVSISSIESSVGRESKARAESSSSAASPQPIILFSTRTLTPDLKASILQKIKDEVKSLSEKEVRERITAYEENVTAATSTHNAEYLIELNQFKAVELLKAYVELHKEHIRQHPEVEAGLAFHLATEMLRDEANSPCLPCAML